MTRCPSPIFLVAASHRPPRQFVEVARIVEELGFDGVSVADHLYVPATPPGGYLYSDDGRPPFDVRTPWPDPLILVAAAAAVTTRLRFVTGVYILPLRHPILVARALATIEALVPGRFEFGVGVGWMREEFEALQADFARRGSIMDDAIDLLRKLLGGGLVEHDGRFFPLAPTYFEPHLQQPVPILIGGTSERAMRRAAERGDGFIAPPGPISELLEQARHMRDLRAALGRADEPFAIRARPTDAESVDHYRTLLEHGITSFVVPALTGSPSEVRETLAVFAEDIVRPVKALAERGRS